MVEAEKEQCINCKSIRTLIGKRTTKTDDEGEIILEGHWHIAPQFKCKLHKWRKYESS